MHRRIRPRIFSRRTKHVSPWPLQLTVMPIGRRRWPQPGPAVIEETPAATALPADDGELTASPWTGLHYTNEWS